MHEQVVLGGAAHFIEKSDVLAKQELRLSLKGRRGNALATTHVVQMTEVLKQHRLKSPGPIWFSAVEAAARIEAHIEVEVVGLSVAN